METYGRFLFEFLHQFFSGFGEIIGGIGKGIINIFNFSAYYSIVKHYANDFQQSEWFLTGLAVICMLVVIGGIFAIIIFFLKKHMKWRKKVINQEELLQQIDSLNEQVEELVDEKMKLLSMKAPDLGIKPGLNSSTATRNISTTGVAAAAVGVAAGTAGMAGATATSARIYGGGVSAGGTGGSGGENDDEQIDPNSQSRFSKLALIDEEYLKYKQKDYRNSFTLPEFCYMFRNFAASKLKLYYSEKMIRLFVSAIASTKLVILQGISGTGKTSISLAWGNFVKHPSCVASVQPSWRDRTDILGYLNEFTKKFNETDFLAYLYEAGYTDEIYTVILDEMNLARVEYYFAEMLSILEMHSTKDWKIEVVQSSWPTDPKKLIRGKLQIPPNAWYIGTINNDDSTFMVTDKVYDRAMPIDINEKGIPFEPDDVDAIEVNYSYLNGLFEKAMSDYAISPATLKKIDDMDNYTIKHFRVAFGNRIVKHMRKFVPVYVACGGDETEAVDYFMAKKVLRKFEALNLALIRDEIDGYIEFLDKNFGKGKMSECIEFLLRLKKMS